MATRLAVYDTRSGERIELYFDPDAREQFSVAERDGKYSLLEFSYGDFNGDTPNDAVTAVPTKVSKLENIEVTQINVVNSTDVDADVIRDSTHYPTEKI